MKNGISKISLGSLKPVKTGKVREIYDMGKYYLFIATDRISAYDYILNNTIPDKGKVLNQLSIFWFNFLSDVINTHYVADDIFSCFPDLKEYSEALDGRSMLVTKSEVVPIECVVRGYITGSAWVEYTKKGTVNEVPMPKGLKESQAFTEPLFTPSTKAESGHDENIHFNKMCDLIGLDLSNKLREKSLAIYCKARDYMNNKGIVLADTKFEFGITNNEVILIDEVLTPDSSRFWPKDKYDIGRGQESFDKQYVRDYLNEIKWDRNPPVPNLPENVVERTRDKYLEIFNIITGQKLK
ncbi:MAG: hypothetical protein ACD_79C00275G0002 [uncultured bacterium]|nr:MAG: hypothetical protein ACD_79C00275G0002 [uncultured bacterium]